MVAMSDFSTFSHITLTDQVRILAVRGWEVMGGSLLGYGLRTSGGSVQLRLCASRRDARP